MINGNSLILQFGKETTYGEGGTPSRQIKVASESFKPMYNKIEEGLLTGGKAGSKKETMSIRTEGSISTLARPDDVGFFLKATLGNEEVSSIEDEKVFLHTFKALGTNEDDVLPSIFAIADKKVNKFLYNGLKINSLSFSASPEDYLKLDLNLVGRNETTNAEMNNDLLPTTLKSFKFRNGKVKIAGQDVADITSINFNYENQLDTQTQTTSTGVYYKEPNVGVRTIQTTLEAIYTSELEQIRELYYKTDETVSIELLFDSEYKIPETDIYYQMKITIPCNQLSDATANFGSAETIKQSMTFDAFEENGQELITIDLINGEANEY